MHNPPDTSSIHLGARRMSILKIHDSDARPPTVQPKEIPIVIQPSFLRLRDSISGTQLMDIPEKISTLLVDDLDEDEEDDDDLKEEDSLEEDIETESKKQAKANPFPDEGDENGFSRGVQKNWNTNEDIVDKGVQAGAAEKPHPIPSQSSPGNYVYDITRPSDALYYSTSKDLSDIYDNFEQDTTSSSRTNTIKKKTNNKNNHK